MSHLQRIIAYREALTNRGVGCPAAQAQAVEEAFIRAILMNHTKFNDGFSFTETEDDCLIRQLDKWNSVSPIRAKFILESAKLRLHAMRNQLIADGTLLGNAQYDIYAEIETAVELEVIKSKINVSDCEVFRTLVQYLYVEMRGGHE